MIKLERKCDCLICKQLAKVNEPVRTITRDPSHEELQEIAGRAVKVIVSWLRDSSSKGALVSATNYRPLFIDTLTYIKDGITWNVKEGE